MLHKNFFKLFIFGLLVTYFSASAVTNKTLFMPRAIGEDAVLQNISDLYMLDRKEEKSKHYPMFNLTNILFYDQSTCGQDLAKYFLPNNKHELVVKGYAVEGEKDIAAEWLRIVSAGDRNDADDFNFSSKFSISPRQSRFGDIIKVHRRLDFISKKLWFQAYFPIVQVSTDLHLKEFDIKNQRNDSDVIDFPETHNVTQALKTPLMFYGKIININQKISGLADIDLKLGYKPIKELSIYLKGVIPTACKPRTRCLFEPILGNGNHWGFGAGANFDLKCLKHFNFLSNLDYVYLFKTDQKRSFDLKDNGPWSRYLAATNGVVQTRPIPLINFLTEKLNVTPGSIVNFVGAFHFNYKAFNAEAGYNFWYREAEKVSRRHKWDKHVGIAFFNEFNPSDFAVSYQSTYKKNNDDKIGIAKINENMVTPYDAPVPPVFVAIDKSNLKVSSAGHPDALSNKIYLTAGFDAKWHDSLTFMNLGASYEFGSSNKALSMWSIWWQTSLYF